MADERVQERGARLGESAGRRSTERFGAYEILYELKAGGMGAVLLARRKGPGAFEQLVAIKTIRPEYGHVAAVRAMFLDEAAILARVSHPAIATVHDFGEEAGTLYMAMEYVAGIPFRDLAELRPPPLVAARAVAEAARGLHAAHEVRDTHGTLLGVVHRDISPDNLMLGFDGHVKVIDFGIALVKNRMAPVTEFGTLKGKPPYMSPEQVKNEALDRRSDVFSLAVVLHELLTGAPLFDGESIYAIARAVEHQQLVPPSRVLRRELPSGLDGAVMGALERDPARRTQTAAALAEVLEQVVAASGDETLEAWAERELAEPRTAHRRWIAGVIAGHDRTPPPIGRPTGSVTALGPGQLATLPAPVVEEDAPPSPPRRRVLPILATFVLLLGATAGVLWLLQPAKESPRPPSPRDAPVVASIDARAIDAAVVVEIDAPLPPPPPIDAGHVIAKRRDAGVAVAPPPPPKDAAVPAGTGKLTVRNRAGGTFRNVFIDGQSFQATPFFNKPIPAGNHTIVLRAPDSNDVVYETNIHVNDGQTVTVQEP
jgi:eukaryotic-like serine/threonine-protein kinase